MAIVAESRTRVHVLVLVVGDLLIADTPWTSHQLADFSRTKIPSPGRADAFICSLVCLFVRSELPIARPVVSYFSLKGGRSLRLDAAPRLLAILECPIPPAAGTARGIAARGRSNFHYFSDRPAEISLSLSLCRCCYGRIPTGPAPITKERRSVYASELASLDIRDDEKPPRRCKSITRARASAHSGSAV